MLKLFTVRAHVLNELKIARQHVQHRMEDLDTVVKAVENFKKTIITHQGEHRRLMESALRQMTRTGQLMMDEGQRLVHQAELMQTALEEKEEGNE